MRTLRQISPVVATLATLSTYSVATAQTPPANSTSASVSTPARPLPMVSFAQLIERALPAVVSIRVTGETLVPAPLRAGDQPAAPTKRTFRSGGSGVIVNAELGLIATNNHVVRDAVTIEVGLHDGRETPATLVGIDAGTDVALIKVELKDLTPMAIGDSSQLRVGDFVIAIGNPFGLEGSASAGIVSGLKRTGIGYDIYESFIQVDAAVNPGNSGGALINLDGELVGINTAVGRQGGAAVAGIAFAIPINMARRVGMQLYKHGHMRRGSLGFETTNLSPALAKEHNLPNRRGALVSRVAPGSPADYAGIRPGCIIVSVNGLPVRNSNDFIAHFGGSVVGDELEIEIMKPTGTRTYWLTVTDQLNDPPSVTVSQDVQGLGGLTVSAISPRSPLYGQIRGVVVTNVEPGGPAHAFGLRADDIIQSLNELTISEANQLSDLAQYAMPVERARITRAGTPYIVEFRR
jgi:Do/DeqQ family serine protease